MLRPNDCRKSKNGAKQPSFQLVPKVFGKRFEKRKISSNTIFLGGRGNEANTNSERAETSKRERDEKHARCQFAEAGAQIDDGGDWREGAAAR
jgi:hypothetical protein